MSFQVNDNTKDGIDEQEGRGVCISQPTKIIADELTNLAG